MVKTQLERHDYSSNSQKRGAHEVAPLQYQQHGSELRRGVTPWAPPFRSHAGLCDGIWWRTFSLAAVGFLLLIPFTIMARAQDKSIERIKKLYEETGKKIELSEKGTEDSSIAGIFCNELVVNKNAHIWPVVGNYEMTYKFYYELSHTEGHPYPDQLRKVIMKSSMSARSYYAEYLFDDSGALVFYYSKPNEPPIGDEPERLEQRIYFAASRPIRIINGQVTSNALNAKDLEFARGVVTTSKQIKLFFTNSLNLPNE